MDHEEILDPVALYRGRLKAEHADRTAQAFEEFVRLSGIDESANAALMAKIRKLEAAIADLGFYLGVWKFFRFVLVLAALAGIGVGVIYVLPKINPEWHVAEVSLSAAVAGFGIGIALLILVFAAINRRIARIRADVDIRQKALAEKRQAAWEMMAPLNRLYRWDTIAQLVMQTIPIVAIDPYFCTSRQEQLCRQFQWDGATDECTSVLGCQSGAVNGNPWGVFQALRQKWEPKTYTGTLTITWQEKVYYTDSRGNTRSRWVTRTQVLVAHVDKPAPVYREEKFLVYGNEAAPELNFSRKPNDLAESRGFWGKRKLKSAIAALEKKSRDLNDPFTIMDNREFDACFHAVDRDNEQQFRLLFTPLAQQEMLKLLRDREFGYGDDFRFLKHGMINILSSAHLDRLDINASPERFKNCDLAAARQEFNRYSNEFFRSLYFSFAPLFCIPIYQQHRNFADVYAGIVECDQAAFGERESFANAIGEAHFAPTRAATRSILKTRINAVDGEALDVEVTAHAFRTEERVDFVPVYGGDGAWHDVPVPWQEYLPVARRSHIAICPTGTSDVEKFTAELATDRWQEHLQKLNADGTAWHFRRNLAAFLIRS